MDIDKIRDAVKDALKASPDLEEVSEVDGLARTQRVLCAQMDGQEFFLVITLP